MHLAESPHDPERWWKLLQAAADVQMRMDRNRSLRQKSPALSGLSEELFRKARGEGARHEIQVARCIASVYLDRYSIFHNIYGLALDAKRFEGDRPASAVWNDSEP